MQSRKRQTQLQQIKQISALHTQHTYILFVLARCGVLKNALTHVARFIKSCIVVFAYLFQESTVTIDCQYRLPVSTVSIE